MQVKSRTRSVSFRIRRPLPYRILDDCEPGESSDPIESRQIQLPESVPASD